MRTSYWENIRWEKNHPKILFESIVEIRGGHEIDDSNREEIDSNTSKDEEHAGETVIMTESNDFEIGDNNTKSENQSS